MKEPDIGKSHVGRLADLLSLQDEAADWSRDDLGAILTHQMSAPFDHELARLDDKAGQILSELQGSNHPLPTIGQVLSDPKPNCEFLSAIKRFGKDQGRLQQLPREVAGVIYLAAISAAILRCRRRLSDMDDSSLVKRLEWALGMTFLNDELRLLFEATLATVK